MELKPELTFDENLREVPKDPRALRRIVKELESLLSSTSDPQKQVSIVGEIAVWLRILGELELAEQKIGVAFSLITENDLGIGFEIQQKIRLANILQWKKQFDQSNALFAQIISVCRSNLDARSYLDFALQHAGKNLFDQNRFREALTCFEESLDLRVNRKAPKDQIESTEHAIARTQQLLENNIGN